ncbi:MAG: hypothetical protein RR413_05025 [Christensenellaceae bacterium]
MSNTRKILSNLQGTPLYQPQKVYVITDEKNFSAAFHYAFYLWKMGAIIVGVPSSQAPNTFMEQTPFQLPYSKLNGCISNSLQVFMPAQDRRAKTFYPDIIPTYQTYKKFNFDYHTEIRYLLEMGAYNFLVHLRWTWGFHSAYHNRHSDASQRRL